MDQATRERISEHASLASWLRFVPCLPELAAAGTGPDIVADWLEACWPQAKAGSLALLRALQGQHWRIATADVAGGGLGRLRFVIHAGQSAWTVRLHAGSSLIASRVERLPAPVGSAER